jgi:phosphatidylglycerol lysyltransferase
MSDLSRWGRWLQPSAIAVGAVVMAWFVHRELQHYSYHEIVGAWRNLPWSAVVLGGGLTALSYLLLTGYDFLALRHLSRKMGVRRTAFASFTAFVVTNNVGLGALGSGAVRLRFYGAWGLSAAEILTMQAFVGITFWLGLASVAGGAWLITGGPFGEFVGRLVGGGLILVVGLYVGWCAQRRKPVTFRRWSLTLPEWRIALAQVGLGALDIAVAGTVLWVMLPAGFGSWPVFVALYAGALAVAVISGVPGGLGVLEAMVLLGRPEAVPADTVMAGLVAFRLVYYLAPLAVAVLGLAGFETRRHRARLGQWIGVAGRWLPAIAPRVLAAATFMAGVMLLVSGATPSVHGRIAWLNDFLPLPIIETSHLVGSLAGVGLLLLARGLQRRLDVAYLLTLGMLGAGIFASMLKGLDWEEALTLAVMLVALVPCRSFFDRKSSLLAERFTPGWIVAILLVIGGVTWLGIFAYRHVEYRDALWWRFSPLADAPRFLRAQFLVIVGGVGFGLHRLLRVSSAPFNPATIVDSVRLTELVAKSRSTSTQLVWLGDKTVELSRNGQALIMYGRSGHSWVSLGDPVGAIEADRRELIWTLRERAERAGGRTVFYEIDRTDLALYVDAGFGLTKIGEEARVPLAGFSLAGGARKALRSTVSKLEREGAVFEWIEVAAVDGIMTDLRRISEGWLEQKSTKEKGFSLGFFDEGYLRRNPMAVVRCGGKIVGFANILCGADHEELSIDLMRYDDSAPSGLMDFLFVKLMLRGAAEGYRWFNLGMAPLSGMESHQLAPISHRIGGLIFRHADHFYGFQGLRAYKDKFDPVWAPKYVAVTGLWQLPAALTDVASLISGGLKGVFMK